MIANREGLIAAAEHGTLFLDEIGDLSPTMQASLLRVLQSGEVRPLGSARQRWIDLRVVAATNRDLPTRVRKGEFRDDLWARLNGFALQLGRDHHQQHDRPDDHPRNLKVAPGQFYLITRRLAVSAETLSISDS